MKYHLSLCIDKIYLQFVNLQKFYVQHFRILKMASQHMPLHQETSGVPLHSIVYFTCIGGFRLSSDVILTCLFNGSWSESPPICLGAHWNFLHFLPFLDSTFSHSRWNSLRNKKWKCAFRISLIQINKLLILNFEIKSVEHLILLIWKIRYILMYTCTTICTYQYGLHFFFGCSFFLFKTEIVSFEF